MATAEAEVEAFLSKAGPAHFSGALNEKVKDLLVHTTELKGRIPCRVRIPCPYVHGAA